MNSPEELVWQSRELPPGPADSEKIADVFSESNIRRVLVQNNRSNRKFEVVYRDSVYRFSLADSDWNITFLIDLERERHHPDDLNRYLVNRVSQGWFDVVHNGYSPEILTIIERLESRFGNSREEICTLLVNTIEHNGASKPENALRRIAAGQRLYYEFDRNEYDPIDSWSGKGCPPYVDTTDWIEGPFDNSQEVRREFREQYLSYYRYEASAVYIIDCHFLHPSLDTAIDMAEERLDHVPDWLETAFEADRVLYVGETRQLPIRMATHAFGLMSDSPPPAALTRLTEMKAAGVVFRTRSANRAQELEAAYADNLSTVTPDGVFVYSN